MMVVAVSPECVFTSDIMAVTHVHNSLRYLVFSREHRCVKHGYRVRTVCGPRCRGQLA